MDDKVKALMYAAALAPPKGASINDLGAGQPPPPRAEALKPDSGGYLRLGDEGIAKYFAQDLPAKEISVIAATQGPAFSVFSTRSLRRPPTRPSRAGMLSPSMTA